MAAIDVRSAIKVASISIAAAGTVAFAQRSLLPTEAEEDAYKQKSGKNILTGVDVEVGIGVSSAATAVATGAALVVLNKLGKPVPGIVAKAPFIAGGIGAGILLSHGLLKPLEVIAEQVGPTIEYMREN